MLSSCFFLNCRLSVINQNNGVKIPIMPNYSSTCMLFVLYVCFIHTMQILLIYHLWNSSDILLIVSNYIYCTCNLKFFSTKILQMWNLFTHFLIVFFLFVGYINYYFPFSFFYMNFHVLWNNILWFMVLSSLSLRFKRIYYNIFCPKSLLPMGYSLYLYILKIALIM